MGEGVIANVMSGIVHAIDNVGMRLRLFSYYKESGPDMMLIQKIEEGN